jgi:uncharacterized iron-regulated membrane protein
MDVWHREDVSALAPDGTNWNDIWREPGFRRWRWDVDAMIAEPVAGAPAVALGSLDDIRRKVLKELFTLRWGRSARVVTADVHRVVGVWALGFHVLIAFTGAWLGLAPVFERGYAYLARAQQPPQRMESALEPAVPLSLDRLLEQARRDVPDLRVQAILLSKRGRPDASVRLSGQLENSVLTGVSLTYSAATGALLDRHDPREAGLLRYVEGFMEPLHFGNFGGVVLAWLYFLLGLTPAALALSGTLVWLERRKLEARAAQAVAAEAPRAADTGAPRATTRQHRV